MSAAAGVGATLGAATPGATAINRPARAVVGLLVQATVGAAAWAAPPVEAWQQLETPAFKAAYAKALGVHARTPWLSRRDGPAPLPRYLDVAGGRYVINAFCKNHDCEAHSAVVLYDAGRQVVYGTVFDAGKTTVIGDPPPAVAAALAQLWQAEWRSAPK